MKLLFILITLFIAAMTHKGLIRYNIEPYRWVVCSLTYLFTSRKLKRSLLRMSENELSEFYIHFNRTDFWFKKYWFGRKYLSTVDDYVILMLNK